MAGVVVSKDVIAEILAKLPVKSLLRFNCVCKTWYSVISDPQFSNNLHRMKPCVLICDRELSTITIESLLTAPTPLSIPWENLFWPMKNRAPTPLSLPWETEPYDYRSENLFLGSCNGLVCVDHKNKSSPDRSGLILWNPSTRKFRGLPRPGCYSDDLWGLPRPGCYSVQDALWTYFWFGYDESIDDYKLVRLNCSRFYQPPIVTELDVFTLKSNTWRRPPVDRIALRGINNGLNKSIGVLSNGAIHWLARYFPSAGDTDGRILALDLATEKFRLFKFSHASWGVTPWVGSLLGGCLCLGSCARDEDGSRVWDLWMMKEYGVESSWTKLLSIPFNLICPDLEFYPILFSKEGKEMLVMCNNSRRERTGRIVKLRVEGAKKVKYEETLLRVRMDRSRNNVFLHMNESLVSLSAD